jgi:hypothetical protein
MKVLGAGNFIFPDGGITPELLIRFALSQPADMNIVGCSTPAEARALADLGKHAEPMGKEEQDRLVDPIRPHARRLAYYRGTL